MDDTKYFTQEVPTAKLLILDQFCRSNFEKPGIAIPIMAAYFGILIEAHGGDKAEIMEAISRNIDAGIALEKKSKGVLS